MLLWSIYWFETRESLKLTNIVIEVSGEFSPIALENAKGTSAPRNHTFFGEIQAQVPPLVVRITCCVCFQLRPAPRPRSQLEILWWALGHIQSGSNCSSSSRRICGCKLQLQRDEQFELLPLGGVMVQSMVRGEQQGGFEVVEAGESTIHLHDAVSVSLRKRNGGIWRQPCLMRCVLALQCWLLSNSTERFRLLDWIGKLSHPISDCKSQRLSFLQVSCVGEVQSM